MAKKVTTEDFVERAREVHGDVYDYSEAVYAGTHEKLRIVCPEHGVFEQSPANHLKGRGCPECGKVKAGDARRSSKDAFVKRAREVHGDFYDYSQVEYRTGSDKVVIVCPEHGPYLQTPSGHLSGRGCRRCAGNMPYTTESFVEAAKAVHGDAFDYSKVEYRGVHEKVCIVCPTHGEFWQEPVHHLKGGGCPTCSKIRGHELHRDHDAEVAKRQATMMERYGAIHALECDEFKEKARGTWMEHYGVDHPMRDDGVKQGYCDTMRQRYGVDYPYQSEELFGKAQQAWMERYGADSPLAAEEVRAKIEETCMERYGVSNPLASDEVRAKIVETWQDEYGVDNPLKADEVKAKVVETCQDRYGADWPLGSDIVRDKIVETLMEKYGVDCPFKSEEIRDKIVDTWMENYGVDNPFKSEEVRAKAIETWMENYGVNHPCKSEVVLEKIYQTKRENGTFNTSEPEERLHSMLVDFFGETDVQRQFSDERYPFACDFYIASLDLFIELNAAWTHGGRWFDSEDPACLEKLRAWIVRSGDSEYYRNAISVWTGSDVRKRMQAQAMGLNYAVFWDNDLTDAMTWFDQGCPVRHDWE